MTARNHFTPFIVDDPGPEAREAMLFDGEAKRRQQRVPSRRLIGFAVIVGIGCLIAAAAMASQTVLDLEHRYEAEALV